MSIRENLSCNEKFGCIKVIEDLGRNDMTSNVANHALVFMMYDPHKKWKQPVAY
jgi:hypothetical protein